jgi:hypothetical protein
VDVDAGHFTLAKLAIIGNKPILGRHAQGWLVHEDSIDRSKS